MWHKVFTFFFFFFPPNHNDLKSNTKCHPQYLSLPKKVESLNPADCPKTLFSCMPLAARSSQTLIRIDRCFTPSHQMKHHATGVSAQPSEAWHDVEVQVFTLRCLSGDQTKRKTHGGACDATLDKRNVHVRGSDRVSPPSEFC